MAQIGYYAVNLLFLSVNSSDRINEMKLRGLLFSKVNKDRPTNL
jgi:hypothetical protein